MTRFLVHNHDYDPTCRERTVAGRLVGACMVEPDYVFEAHLEGMDCGRRPCGTCAPSVDAYERATAQRELSAAVAANAERRAAADPRLTVAQQAARALALAEQNARQLQDLAARVERLEERVQTLVDAARGDEWAEARIKGGLV